MSEVLYSRLVWWNGSRGLAKSLDVTVALREAPQCLPGACEVEMGEVEAGRLTYAEVRDRPCDPRRDMTADEVLRCRLWLEKVRGATLAAMRGDCP
jgi:hypothetical protein